MTIFTAPDRVLGAASHTPHQEGWTIESVDYLVVEFPAEASSFMGKMAEELEEES